MENNKHTLILLDQQTKQRESDVLWLRTTKSSSTNTQQNNIIIEIEHFKSENI